jgi:hypothetical protein
MGIRVALHHKTLYEYYDRLVTLSPQIVRLRPAPHSRTRVTHRQLLAKLLMNAVTGDVELYFKWTVIRLSGVI